MTCANLRNVEVDPAPQEQSVAGETIAARPQDRLDRVVDFLDRVMPDMAFLGLIVSILTLYLAATGSDFGASEDVFAPQRDAAEAAEFSPGYVPF